VEGIVTNIPFHRWALMHPRFLAGDLDTGFIPQEFHGLPVEEDELHQNVLLAAAALAAYHKDQALTRTPPQGGGKAGMSAWRSSGWR
jgi:acetyl/propionyl-CoA carboxylase alpha subunit